MMRCSRELRVRDGEMVAKTARATTPPIPSNRVKRFVLLYLVAIFVVAPLIFFATPHGIGASPDSVKYIKAAESLLQGNGLTLTDAEGTAVPMTHYPPLYPMTLAAGSLGVLDMHTSARIINALALAGLITMAVLLVDSNSSGDRLSTFTGLLVFSSTSLFSNYLRAWSEPTFLLLTALALFLLARWKYESNNNLLIVAGLVAGLATLARYAGIALILSGGLFIVLSSRREIRALAFRLGAFLATSIFPLAIWLLYNSSRASTATNRTLAWHPVTGETLSQGISSIGTWIMPGQAVVPSLGLGVVTLTIIMVCLARNSLGQHRPLVVLCSIFLLLYSIFIIASISLFDAHTPLDGRILSPLNMAWLLCLVPVARASRERLSGVPFVRLVPLGLMLIILSLNLYATGSVIETSRNEGIGYSDRLWRESRVMGLIHYFPSDVRLYSNAPDAIYFHTGRLVEYPPLKYDPTTLRPNSDYGQQVQVMVQAVEHGATVVHFHAVRRPYLPAAEELASQISVKPAVIGTEAVVFSSNPESTSPYLASE